VSLEGEVVLLADVGREPAGEEGVGAPAGALLDAEEPQAVTAMATTLTATRRCGRMGHTSFSGDDSV
jgi:hypothetical protein